MGTGLEWTSYQHPGPFYVPLENVSTSIIYHVEH